MDLLAGELSPEEEGSLRAAIGSCDVCGPEFEMMALLMDFSGPALKATAPSEIDAVIMTAAKAHIQQARVASPTPSGGIWARIAEWLESFAMGPQFAMATVMVLVVAVGFWYVPKNESHEVAGSTVVLSDPEGEAVAADDPGQAPALLGAGERNEVASELEIERAPVLEETESPEVSVPTPPTKVATPTVPMRALPPPPAQNVQTATDMAMTRAVTRTPADYGVSANEGNDIETVHQQSAAWAMELEGMPMPSYSDDPPAPTQRAPSAQATNSTLGTRPADESSLGLEAAEVPAPTTASPSRALLQLARNHRAQARCDEAVRHYESLLARFASSPEVPAALMESADCYRRMGRISDAERALQRALQFASTRTNARRELTRLETIRAAQRETYAPSSAPESVEASY